MKNTIIIHNNWAGISNLISKITKNDADIFILQDFQNIVVFEKAQMIIIDNSYSLKNEDIKLLKQMKLETIFINNPNQDLGKNLTQHELLISLNSENSQLESQPKFTKSANIFNDFDSFKLSITQEVRRAKRYNYPFVVVMFQLLDSQHHQKIIDYFASKIREFDSLWIYDKNYFSMILPHTGWNGAEILTSRLTTFITKEININVDSLKNTVISFKRIEQDKDFIERVKSSLHGEYYTINKSVSFNVWKDELFSEFLEAKTIRIFNRYKGLLISHDSDIILSEDKLELNNIRAIQLSIINSEKATYFHSKILNKTIRASVQTIDIENSSATLSNFEFIDSEFIKNTSVKLLIEEDMEISISDKLNQLSAQIIEMSLDEITIEVQNNSNFKIDSEFDLDFKINKSYNIRTNAKVISIEKGAETSYIDFQISTSINDNMKMSDFISQKQIQFIKELR